MRSFDKYQHCKFSDSASTQACGLHRGKATNSPDVEIRCSKSRCRLQDKYREQLSRAFSAFRNNAQRFPQSRRPLPLFYVKLRSSDRRSLGRRLGEEQGSAVHQAQYAVTTEWLTKHVVAFPEQIAH